MSGEMNNPTLSDIASYFETLVSDWCAGETCEYCKHWNSDKFGMKIETVTEEGEAWDVAHVNGECRRYPPHAKHGHPATRSNDECGEWEEGSKEEAAAWAVTFRTMSEAKGSKNE